MAVSNARRLRTLEDENAKLKKLLAVLGHTSTVFAHASRSAGSR
jgi:hypothetical protein